MPFNFVEKLLELTEIVESPTSYLRWCGYITLGAVMRYNVFYKFPSRRTIVTPNMYLMLVGDSGATRKSTPLKICNFLLKKVGNTKLIEGRSSIQGILKELAAIKTIDKPHRRQLKYAAGVIYSEEFAAAIVKDPSVTGILTDIYDYHEEHDVLLKSEDTMKLEKVCVNLFSATNGAFIQDMFTKTDLYGGLVGRTFFVIEEKARHKNLGLRDTTDENEWQLLVNHLTYLSKLEGPIRMDEATTKYLEDWYEVTDFTLHESKTGYEHRAHTHVLKLAMILAAAEEGFDLTVRQHHCEQAIDIVTEMRKNYHKMVVTTGFSQNTIIQATRDITICLFQNPDRALSKDDILRSLFGRVDIDSFDKAITTLQQTGFIEIGGTNIPRYGLTTKGREIILGEMKIGGKAN